WESDRHGTVSVRLGHPRLDGHHCRSLADQRPARLAVIQDLARSQADRRGDAGGTLAPRRLLRLADRAGGAGLRRARLHLLELGRPAVGTGAPGHLPGPGLAGRLAADVVLRPGGLLPGAQHAAALLLPAGVRAVAA